MKQNIKIDPYGFREYDARWLYEESINESGIENLGKGLGTQIKKHSKKDNPRPSFTDKQKSSKNYNCSPR